MVWLDGAEPERLGASRATRDYLPLYGRTPFIGRAFTAGDELLGAPPVVIVGIRLSACILLTDGKETCG